MDFYKDYVYFVLLIIVKVWIEYNWVKVWFYLVIGF